MCVSAAGKILLIDGNTARVSVNNNVFNVNIKLISPKIGDYVLIHSGIAIEILTKITADEITEIFKEIFNDID